VVLAAAFTLPTVVLAQDGSSSDGSPAAAVSWRPVSPGEGEMFAVHVEDPPGEQIVVIAGTALDEPLHFDRTEDGALESLAAVPLGVTTTVPVKLTVIYGDGRERAVEASVPVTPGTYHHAQLTVAPALGAPPTPAQKARRDRETQRAMAVSDESHRTPRMWTEDIVLPKHVERVTSGFGDGRIFNGQVSGRHDGLDLDGQVGDTVVAATRGVVALVDTFELAGNMVYINHGGGLVTAYFHLSKQLVTEGDTVDAGTPIGLVGATGRVTGPHLHWVVRYGRVSVDGRSLIAVEEDR
jgi:murein DD-endopeptidase MepM/ murein hydrolase activator NlpD